MGITLSDEERSNLRKTGGGYSVVDLPSAETQPKSIYHNITTGKEFYNLPADPWNVSHYKQRGLIIGPAPNQFKPVVEESTPDSIEDIIKVAVRAALEAAGVALPDVKEKEGDPTTIIKTEPVQMRMFK